ncbi:HAD superfamily hydrolase (TIGR01509 family) [Streptosporangium becharense]|uniref:HAD superfamily hydrolase (TIGR01509 family) n=1 Tax=Streptosporangium becharense TaxID=1816182 RepID=A0A7W9ICU0_9ACTN|nr:HAD family phosphatase [Streptosporangium becharense]MBB2913773.1 HAD superfamily hydrolase (TIGR01509 family) [Streptosporangium becharense]MBB5817854.1 HAD superfamily hydrolase (TIGR01509 family) [Streptosporangium becharense]
MQAVLFDMDGLLVDSEKIWFEVESEVMERLGGRWGHGDQEHLVGGSMPSTVAYMLQVAGGGVSPEEVTAWMLDGMITRLSGGVEMMPGAAELLAAVRRAGLPTALVTSSLRPIAEACLESIGRHNFDHVVTGDQVARPKPDPEPYLTATRLLGAEPARCVVLEDSPNGVTAATAAGCRVVAVPSVVPVPEAPGRLVVGSLLEVDVETLRELSAREI